MTRKSQKQQTNADAVAAQVEKRNTIERRACANLERRNRLERSPADWLKHYLAGTYTRPFEKPHIEIIRGTVDASATDGRFVVAAERGIGKSAILWGMILFLALTGKRQFPVCVPWADKALGRAFKFWKNALCFNERLLADYPEFCQPFAHARGIAQRVPNVVWADNGKLTGAQLTVGAGLIVLPDGRGCIGGATINGNIRGLNHPQEDGTILRPDIVLLDDVQDRDTAKSPAQVNETIAVIDGDVAGCGAAGRDLPMLMACNCIVRGDVAEHYLTEPEWKALRVPCVEQWPDLWDDGHGEAKRLWDEWNTLRNEEKDDIAFYEANRDAMTRGMVLSAPAAFAGSSKCPDAFYGVIRMYCRMGHDAFMAERQQAPVDQMDVAGPYTLKPAIIAARAEKGRKVFERPEWVTRVVASTDINPSYAMSTAIVGFGEDQTAAVLWYGLHKMALSDDMPAPAFAAGLFNALVAHGKALAALPVRPEVWAADAGGKQFDGVVRFAEASARLCGIQAHGFTGRGSKNYRPYGRTVSGQLKEQCHGCLDRKAGRIIRWVAWNADHWKEVAQRAWLGELGTPGCVSIYEGNHNEFAAQICAEKLVGKGEIGGLMIWNWHTVPGRHDFGDVMAQAYALAAYMGIGTGGRSAFSKKRVAVIDGRRVGISESKENKEGTGNAGSSTTNGGGQQKPKHRVVIGRRGWR